jgi:hypothetical protein
VTVALVTDRDRTAPRYPVFDRLTRATASVGGDLVGTLGRTGDMSFRVRRVARCAGRRPGGIVDHVG